MDNLLQSPRGVAYAVAAVLIVGWLIYNRLFGAGGEDTPPTEEGDIVEPRRRLPLE